MAIIKNEVTNTWEVRTRYLDWTGANKQKTKRGFTRKADAIEWEQNFQLKSVQDIDMTFGDFVDIYIEDLQPRLRENTWKTKEAIINKKILPYFKDKKLSKISAPDVVAWQNEIMNQTDLSGEHYSKTYLKTIHNQLSAILNYAVNMYVKLNFCQAYTLAINI